MTDAAESQQPDLCSQLMAEFPDVFQNDGDYPGMGDGWIRELLWPLCRDLRNIGISPDFHVDQIKEKFGGLRFYVSGATEEQWSRIDQADRDSYCVCEVCGSRENVKTTGGWLKTYCDTCNQSRGGCNAT